MSKPRKNLRSVFHGIKFIVFKRVQLKKGLLRFSATSLFFFHRYLIGPTYSLILVGVRAILISFLSFLSQKTYPRKFSRAEVVLVRTLDLFKNLPSHILPFIMMSQIW